MFCFYVNVCEVFHFYRYLRTLFTQQISRYLSPAKAGGLLRSEIFRICLSDPLFVGDVVRITESVQVEY